MFSQKVVLACSLIVVAAAQTDTAVTKRPLFSLSFLKVLDNFRDSAKGVIRLINTTAQTSANVVNTGIQGLAGAGRQVVNTLTGMKSTVLNGGVDVFKKGVDIGTNMMGMVPGMQGLANMGGGIVKAGGDVVNVIGQTAIRAGNGMANGKFSIASGLAQAGANLAKSGISKASGLAIQGVDIGFGKTNNAVGKIGAAMDSAVEYISEASSRVSSFASNAADDVSQLREVLERSP